MNFFERYADRIIPEPNSGCWLWIGSTTGNGYGNIRRGSRNTYAHRAAFEAVNGAGSAHGLVVRHNCDNPPCVNPDHLAVGTHKDNAEDARRRGRLADMRGHLSPRAKLSPEDAQKAAEMARGGLPAYRIAEAMGVGRGVIYTLLSGKSYQNVNAAVLDRPRNTMRGKHPNPRPKGVPVFLGEEHPLARLKEADVKAIRDRLSRGERGVDLAAAYGVSPATISAIKKKRIWGHV